MERTLSVVKEKITKLQGKPCTKNLLEFAAKDFEIGIPETISNPDDGVLTKFNDIATRVRIEDNEW